MALLSAMLKPPPKTYDRAYLSVSRNSIFDKRWCTYSRLVAHETLSDSVDGVEEQELKDARASATQETSGAGFRMLSSGNVGSHDRFGRWWKQVQVGPGLWRKQNFVGGIFFFWLKIRSFLKNCGSTYSLKSRKCLSALLSDAQTHSGSATLLCFYVNSDMSS